MSLLGQRDFSPDELHLAHKRLGLSAAKAALFFGVSDGKTVRRWWSGESAASKSVHLLTYALIESKSVRDFFGFDVAE